MTEIESNPEKRIALFQRKEIRRVIHNQEWWFVITDVVAALTDSANPHSYFKDMRRRNPSLAETLKGGGQVGPPLGLEFDTAGGLQILQCWNTEGLFRLIQSIPSPKAEPFKRWLARVGYERIAPLSSLWELLAAKLVAHPELIAVARENCARWLREGHTGAARLREWDALLAEAQSSAVGFDRLRAVLSSDDERAVRLRNFHPLAGILTREERRKAKELCGYRH